MEEEKRIFNQVIRIFIMKTVGVFGRGELFVGLFYPFSEDC